MQHILPSVRNETLTRHCDRFSSLIYTYIIVLYALCRLEAASVRSPSGTVRCDGPSPTYILPKPRISRTEHYYGLGDSDDSWLRVDWSNFSLRPSRETSTSTRQPLVWCIAEDYIYSGLPPYKCNRVRAHSSNDCPMRQVNFWLISDQSQSRRRRRRYSPCARQQSVIIPTMVPDGSWQSIARLHLKYIFTMSYRVDRIGGCGNP